MSYRETDVARTGTGMRKRLRAWPAWAKFAGLHPLRRGRTFALVLGTATVIAIAVLDLSTVQAGPITQPADLAPGDEYRLAFVSSADRDGKSADIADYNQFVTNLANAQPELTALGTTWKAIASTASVDARDNTNTNPHDPSDPSVPIYLLDGTTRIANDNTDLWDDIFVLAPLDVQEDGVQQSGLGETVWTGTNTSGIADSGNALGATDGTVLTGRSGCHSQCWIAGQPFDTDVHALNVYGMSGVLTVAGEPEAVPEPATLTLVAFGVVVLAVARSRRRTAA